MIIKNAIPLSIRKNERDLWNNSEYEAIALIEDNVSDLKKTLELFILAMLKNTEIVVSIAWTYEEITMNKVNSIFSNNIYKKFVSKGDFIVKSGAIITKITTLQDILNVIECWGTLDTIQMIFIQGDREEDILRIICDDNYIYNRRNFNKIDTIMKSSILIINDTGDGEELELIFHKKDNLFIYESINSAID